MKRMYEAKCLRDTVQDNPYQYYKAGNIYTIAEDSPVAIHFQRIGAEFPKKEAERIVEEGFPPPRRETELPKRSYSRK